MRDKSFNKKILYLLKGQKFTRNASSPFDYFKMIWKRVPLETSFLKFGILFRIWNSPYIEPNDISSVLHIISLSFKTANSKIVYFNTFYFALAKEHFSCIFISFANVTLRRYSSTATNLCMPTTPGPHLMLFLGLGKIRIK